MDRQGFKPSSYTLLFRVSDYKSTCLVSEFLIKGSLGLGNPLVINREGFWAFYVSKDKLDDVSKSGLNLYKDYRKFKKYSKNFEKYIADARKNIIPKYSKIPNKISIEQFKSLVRELSKFWYFYGLTENIYHDYAYQYALDKKDSKILINLEYLGNLKAEGRKIWDSYVSKGGVIFNLLRYLSDKYLYLPDDAAYLFISELNALFDGMIPSKKFILNRKYCYVAFKNVRKMEVLNYGESMKVTEIFFKI